MKTITAFCLSLLAFAATALLPVDRAHASDAGLITRQSNHSVGDTARRFEEAVKAKGWMFFTRIDHAAAAKQVGLDLKPRLVLVFGFPKGGTPQMAKAATLAIDNPPKALVWQDDSGKVWLTYNAAEYHMKTIYPRHGLPSPPADAIAAYEKLLADIAKQTTD
jgi:uncharacterized protein (DUF302 family)